MYKSILCSLMMLILSSCSFLHVHKPIIEQGNIVSNENVSKLHTGMSPPQVVEVMGTPVLANILTPNRLEYIYTYQNGNGVHTETRITCIFDRGRLKEIQKG